MSRRLALIIKIILPIILLAGVIVLVVVWPPPKASSSQTGEWTCSMHTQIRLPEPGPCPICGMKLIPVSQLGADQERLKRQAGLETEAVMHRELFKEVRTVGKLDYNEARVAYIAAWITGRVDRLYVDFTGIQVKKGDHLVDIYSPSLFVAQDELLLALDNHDKAKANPATFDPQFAANSLEAVRTKLRLLGILPQQIDEIEKTRKRATHLTIYAPIGGTVIEKSVRIGQYVNAGDMLYKIADLDPIWLYLDVYEYDLGWVRYGQPVDVTLEAYSGETFRGLVTFIDPFLDDKTRTVKVRVNLKNPDRKLKPAMYGSAVIRVRLRSDGTPEPTGLEGKYICPMHPEVIQDKAGQCPICEMRLERVPDAKPVALTTKEAPATVKPAQPPTGKVLAVRASAVLDTGRRKVVYRLAAGGAYELVEVQVGPRAEAVDEKQERASYYPVLKGLNTGDQVVVRGGFLIDSQRQIEGMPSLLHPQGQSAANLHSEHGGMTPPKSTPSPADHKH